MKQIHLFCGDPSVLDTQQICALASGSLPEGWEKIATGSQASVFSSDDYFLKLFPRETWRHFIKFYIKDQSLRPHGSGSLIVRKEKKMAASGFLSATIVAHGRVCGREFLLTRRIPGMTFREVLLRSRGKSKFALIQRLAEEISRMHTKGIYHGDLNANNIMVTEKSQGNPLFYFLDNEKNKFYRKTPHRKAVRNLSQLNYLILPKVVNKTDRLRFLITYLTRRKMLKNKNKWWNVILTHFKERKKRKNGQ